MDRCPPTRGELLAGLNRTIGNGACASTFIEGFDDYWENATLWRARNLAPDGAALGYAQTYYDYPNQRINLVRRRSNNAFPLDLKEEAEGCDSFLGAVSFPGRPNYYRNGNIAIEDTTDLHGGYDVCLGQASETLRWLEVPIEGKVRLQIRAASAASGGKMHFVIDGVRHPAVSIPKTGGGQTWVTVDLGLYMFAYNSTHDVSLVWDTGGVSVNWWQVKTVAVSDGDYEIIARQGGEALTSLPAGATGLTPYAGVGSQQWHIGGLGGGLYSLRPAAPGGAGGRYALVVQPDGFCVFRPAEGPGDIPRQEWSLVPAP